MNIKQLAGILAGALIALLGLLWFFQGAGLLQMCPVVCFAGCEYITGGSIFWAMAGAIAFIIGMVIALVSMRRFGTSPPSEK